MTPPIAISRSTLAGQSRRALIELILRGEIAPGDRINESRLATELGVSRTPIREALAGLARDGFLIGEPGRGYVATPLTDEEANELYPILGILEGAAVRRSVVGADDLDALDEINSRLALSGADPDEAIAANFAWHERLISGCPNSRLVEMVKGLWLKVRRYEFAFFAPGAERVQRSVELHKGIVAALRTGDTTEAGRRMEKHWLTDLDHLLPQMKHRPSPSVGT